MSTTPTKTVPPNAKRTIGQRVRRLAWVMYFFFRALPGEVRCAWRPWGEMRRAVRVARSNQAVPEKPVQPRVLIPAKRAAGWRWRRWSYLVRVGVPGIARLKVANAWQDFRLGFRTANRYMAVRWLMREYGEDADAGEEAGPKAGSNGANGADRTGGGNQ